MTGPDSGQDTEPCPACGEPVEATITMMQAHWTLECSEADEEVSA